MFRRHALLALAGSTAAFLSASSLSLAAQAEKSPIPDPDPKKQEKLPDNVDPERYARAPVVLRAKLIQPLGGESGKYGYRMKVIATLKNTVRQQFGPTEDIYTVQALGKGVPRDPGPPAEECTIYIEPLVQRVDGKDVTHWIFLGGSSTQGVSHVANSATRESPHRFSLQAFAGTGIIEGGLPIPPPSIPT